MRPYELRGGRYALWFDCQAKLGFEEQVAVQGYLCGRANQMVTPNGKPLDERSRIIVEELAKKRGVFIPATAY